MSPKWLSDVRKAQRAMAKGMVCVYCDGRVVDWLVGTLVGGLVGWSCLEVF